MCTVTLNKQIWCQVAHIGLFHCVAIFSFLYLRVCVCEQKRHEREMQQEVECRDEETLELKETYSSLQQEVDIKTKKLKKVQKHVIFGGKN